MSAATDKLDADEQTILNAQRGAERDRDRAALKLSSDPENSAHREALQQWEDELAGYQRDLARIAAARRALQAAEVANTVETRQAALDEARSAAIKAGEQRAKAANKVEAAILALGAALRAEGQAATACWDAVIAAANVVEAGTRAVDLAMRLGPFAHASVGTELALLDSELAAATTHKLGQFCVRVGVSHPQPSPAEAAKVELQRLKDELATWALRLDVAVAGEA